MSDAKKSPLQTARYGYTPGVPEGMDGDPSGIRVEESPAPDPPGEPGEIAERFPNTWRQPALRFCEGPSDEPLRPLKVGVVLSGGQAPGGHNVIAGLFDALRAIHPDSELYGFLDGPGGILRNRAVEIGTAMVAEYRNTGGFDMIGSGRDKIESPEQLEESRSTCTAMGLDGLVVIGGDDSNTNAAVLAEYFADRDVPTRIVGVPKTIDGDLRSEHVEMSFGFDTATKVYAELIGNVCRDAASARKYWHFIKLMGRSASHVTLECALATRPNVTIVGEEVHAYQHSMADVVDKIARAVVERANRGKSYGVVLVPEGLIEFFPEVQPRIAELSRWIAEFEESGGDALDTESLEAFLEPRLSEDTREGLEALPRDFRRQLYLDRDAHGNVQVSRIETERLLIDLVRMRLEELRESGDYSGKFAAQHHFFGYEGRAAAPSNFDAEYCYSLGRLSAFLIHARRTGYICSLRNLSGPAETWVPCAVPITSLIHLETRKGKQKPVIRKALVDLEGAPFRELEEHREQWRTEDAYRYPGAIQYFGPAGIADARTCTLTLERGD